MLQHKILALKGTEAGKPEIRKKLFFVESGIASTPFNRPHAPNPPRQ